MMKILRIVLLAWAGVLFLGCGGSSPAMRLGEPGPWEVQIITGGDTTTYIPASETVQDAAHEAGEQSAPGVGAAPAERSSPEPPSERSLDDFTFGFRIQISANEGSMVLAEERKADADTLYTIPAYVEYERGWYKVRLGDFLTRDEAKTYMVNSGIQERYDKAFVAETYVLKPHR